MSQHNYNDNINSFNYTNAFNNVSNNYTVADQRPEILAWLSPLEPGMGHQDIQTRRVDQVGDWLLQTQEYRDWVDGVRGGGSDNSALFCYGDPGVGKTYISSLVIDTLCKQAIEQNAAVACFYCDFAAQEEQTPAAILGSVLRQIVGGLDEVPERIVKAFWDREKVIGGKRLVLSEIVEILQDIPSLQYTFMCIDALDECSAGNRAKLLDSLNQILRKYPGTRIFLTGRPHIQAEVVKRLAGGVVARSVAPAKGDIIIFMRAKLKEDSIPDAMDEDLKEEIIKNIPETVSEIFLLVFLGIETILQETTIHRRRQKLRAMKNGLDLGSAYKEMLGRIQAQEGDRARLGVATLMWISHSARPLRVHEICQALTIEIGSADLNDDNIPTVSTLISCCQGLITVDGGASTVRLIHFTLQEYLRAHPDLFGGAHSTMAETCLTYLNFQSVKGLSAWPSSGSRGAPFLEYASLYWGTHARVELSDCAKAVALELLDQFDDHISAEILWNSICWDFFIYCAPDSKPFSALHCTSYFGITEIAYTLIKTKKWDVNQRDSAGITPLIWAARCGHEEVVSLLLREKHTHPDRQDMKRGRTPLSWAAENGHEGVVRLFLGPQFTNPWSIGRRWGRAPRAVGLVFGRRYVNPDSSDWRGRTSLSWAAGNGHEGIVKLLLNREDVNPDILDTWNCRTPLFLAAENGHEGIAKLLLEHKDVNRVNLNIIGGRTLLSLAIENGHEGIVKLLLERKDVNPNIPDTEYGQTPLLLAAENGHEGIVKLLLGRGDVNPDTPDVRLGQTPLARAAENGHEGVVKLLLERKDVDPGSLNKNGLAPLSLAAGKGHEGIVKLLLQRGDVNSDVPDKRFGRTPLLWAAGSGHEGIVKLLLERNDVNPNIPDTWFGQTSLSLAAMNGHEGVVKLLLERKGVNLDTSDIWPGQTPLGWAAENGHEGIVKLLLEQKDVNPDSLGTNRQTPLSLAAKNGHEGIVKLLLKRKVANPRHP